MTSSTLSTTLVKELREKTGAGMMDCKKALVESSGDLSKAIDILRKKGMARASSKQGRLTSEGVVTSYIHSNMKVGVLLELNCETDFVARTDVFQSLAKDISLHIAAAHPLWVSFQDVPQERVDKEKEILLAQLESTGKSESIREKIIEGKIKNFFKEYCLLSQEFVKDPSKTIENLIQEVMLTLGENIVLKRFARFALGEKDISR